MRSYAPWLVALMLAGCAGSHRKMPADAHGRMPLTAEAREQAGEPFIASTDHGFQDLMDEAMQRMHSGMEGAPRSGDPDRDFVTQMIPHHQGAIDMAKALLLYGKDPGLQRLAKEILTDQQSEIDLMRAWFDAHSHRTAKESP